MRIEARELSLTYHEQEERTVLEESSFIISKKLSVLIGPSGSGKSSILKMLSLSLFPSAGDLLFDGKSYKDLSFDTKTIINNCLFLDESLFENNFTVLDNLALNLDPALPYSERLKIVKANSPQLFPLKNRFWSLSSGQKMKCMLYLASLIKPKLLLIDEPSANLANTDIEWLKNELLSFTASSLTILATNDNRLFDLEAPFLKIDGKKVLPYED